MSDLVRIVNGVRVYTSPENARKNGEKALSPESDLGIWQQQPRVYTHSYKVDDVHLPSEVNKLDDALQRAYENALFIATQHEDVTKARKAGLDAYVIAHSFDDAKRSAHFVAATDQGVSFGSKFDAIQGGYKFVQGSIPLVYSIVVCQKPI